MHIVFSDYCFACGEKNPIGLHLKIIDTENGVKTEFIPIKEYEGYKGILHGGIIATILDEMVAWACIKKGYIGVTAELNIKYKRPMVLGKKYIAYGKINKISHKIILGESEIFDEDNNLIAYAIAKVYQRE